MLTGQVDVSSEMIDFIQCSVQRLKENQQQFLLGNSLDANSKNDISNAQKWLIAPVINSSEKSDESPLLDAIPSNHSDALLSTSGSQPSNVETSPEVIQSFADDLRYNLKQIETELIQTRVNRSKLIEHSHVILLSAKSLNVESFILPFTLFSLSLEQLPHANESIDAFVFKSVISEFITQAESVINDLSPPSEIQKTDTQNEKQVTLEDESILELEEAENEIYVQNNLETLAVDDETFNDNEEEVAVDKEGLTEVVQAQDIVDVSKASDNLDINDTILNLFQSDLPELLEQIDDVMLSIHQEPENQHNISSLERYLHTLKGGARMVDAKALADIAHNAETLLNDIGDGEKTMDIFAIDTLQTSVDKIQNISEKLLLEKNLNSAKLELEEQQAPVATYHLELAKPKDGYRSLLEQVLSEQKDNLPVISIVEQEYAQHKEAIPEALSTTRETIRLPAKIIDKMVATSTEININQTQLTEHLQHFGADIDELMMTAKRLHKLIRTLELETETQIRHSYELEHGSQAKNEEFDPLEMDQYSEIQQLSRFIQEGLNDLGSIEKNLSEGQVRIKHVLKEQSLISREMQQELLATRLTEVSMILPRLRRISRQTANKLNKQIEFEMQGEQCELDRVVLQKITAPLEHMLRNAISHGIESSEERKAAGKPEQGNILFTVNRDGAEIVMRLSDDGRGIDKQSVCQKAVKMGIVKEGDNLSDDEIYRLIFHSGLSTSKSLSQISGRGVGMDIAYSEIKNMGGSLHVSSSGQGSEFTIRLPLTLATNQVLLIEVAGEQYAMPMSNVVALQRVTKQYLLGLLEKDDPEIIYNNQSYSLYQLANILNLPKTLSGNLGDKFPVLFLNINGQTVAYQLDKIAGNREVVIKPLSRMLHNSRLYSAATIQTDGKVILILNASELVQYKSKVKRITSQDERDIDIDQALMSKQLMVMVVDDSITIRKVTESLLKSHGYQIVTAKDGMDALEKLNDNKPDIMLLDIEMPRMDGFELLSNLRNSEKWKYLPIVMISSRTGKKHRKRAEKMGVSEFLGKPYQEETLLNTIQTILVSQENK